MREGAHVEVSVVIAAYNAATTIGDQLSALSSQDSSYRWEGVVVDDGSTDGTADLVQHWQDADPRLRLVRTQGAQSAARARNIGVEVAHGSILLFCDSDDIVSNGWLDAMARATESHPLVVGRLDYDRLNHPGESHYRMSAQTEDPVKFLGIPTVISASFGCQRWLWDELGGLDESFRSSGGEDIDFGLRAHFELGISPAFEHNGLLHYRLRDTPRDAFWQGYGYGRAQCELNQRHAPRAGRKLRIWKIAFFGLLRTAAEAFSLAHHTGRVNVAFRLGNAFGAAAGLAKTRRQPTRTQLGKRP